MAPSLDSTKVAKSKEVGCMSKLLEEVAIDISSTVVFWLFEAEIGSPVETSTLISFSSASLGTFFFFSLELGETSTLLITITGLVMSAVFFVPLFALAEFILLEIFLVIPPFLFPFFLVSFPCLAATLAEFILLEIFFVNASFFRLVAF